MPGTCRSHTAIFGRTDPLWRSERTALENRAERIREGELVIRQGSACLTVRQMEKAGRPLRAPAAGVMTRTIHEHPACRVYYRFQKDGETLFALEAPNAAFEYEYPR